MHLNKSVNKTDEDFVFLKLTFMREVDKKLQLRTMNTLHHMLEGDTGLSPPCSVFKEQQGGLLMASEVGGGVSPRKRKAERCGLRQEQVLWGQMGQFKTLGFG